MGTLSSTEIVPDGEVPGELLRELAELMRRMFGEEELKYTWADIDWHVLLWYEGRLASHAVFGLDLIDGVDAPSRLQAVLDNIVAISVEKHLVDRDWGFGGMAHRFPPHHIIRVKDHITS